MGRGGVRRGAGAGPAGVPQHRVLGLPLVPRDRPRILRGRGGGGAAERGFHIGEGRPGGAPRLGRRVHGRGAAGHRLRRLADDAVAHARGRAVFRGHVSAPGIPRRHGGNGGAAGRGGGALALRPGGGAARRGGIYAAHAATGRSAGGALRAR